MCCKCCCITVACFRLMQQNYTHSRRPWRSLHFCWLLLIDSLITRWCSATIWPMPDAAKTIHTAVDHANGATYRCKFFPYYLLILLKSQKSSEIHVIRCSLSRLGSVVLTLESSRYEHCEGSRRSDELLEFLEQGPGLLTRQTMLRTPFVWIQVKATYSWGLFDCLIGGPSRRVIGDPNVAELFRPRFSAECHRWLHEPLPAHHQRLLKHTLD